MRLIQILFIALLTPLQTVVANDAEVVEAEFRKQGETWHVSATLRHDDAGWDHYADAWQVVDKAGKVLGKRVLYHPHESEQPFTRSQSGIRIPAGVTIVYVEAHDKVHGWNKQRLRIDLNQASGKNFRVHR